MSEHMHDCPRCGGVFTCGDCEDEGLCYDCVHDEWGEALRRNDELRADIAPLIQAACGMRNLHVGPYTQADPIADVKDAYDRLPDHIKALGGEG